MSRFDEYDGPTRRDLEEEELDREEYGEYRQQVAEKARVVNLARRHRNERLNDPWSAA